MNHKSKTIFCDIDGTLIKHYGNLSKQIDINSEMECLPNSIEAINLWDKYGYKIILTTGRRESDRKITENQLSDLGIFYDQLIMGLGNGERILINDKKPCGTYNTAYAINTIRNKGLNHYDFMSKFVTIPDILNTKTEKPWGSEELIEYNDNYVVKKIFMKKNEMCSLQYHELKRETIYILKGTIKLHIGEDPNNLQQIIMNMGEHITIEPYKIHRMEGIEDSYYLETSTNEIWDVLRLQDNYNRV
jgi:mannose-6-phosphate isomerase-like protein (cupin superfamily)